MHTTTRQLLDLVRSEHKAGKTRDEIAREFTVAFVLNAELTSTNYPTQILQMQKIIVDLCLHDKPTPKPSAQRAERN